MAFAFLNLSACDLEPDVGGALTARCDNTDTDPSVDVSWSTDVAPLFLRTTGGCAPCHDPNAAGNIGFTVGGLALTSHEALLRGGARGGASIVVSGAPCSSVLYQKLLPGPPFGARMPLDGPPFLTSAELRIVHDWIAEGAGEN